MQVRAPTLVVGLLATVIISTAVVVPLASWITQPQAVTEYAVQIFMLFCAFIGSAFMIIIAFACKGKCLTSHFGF